MPYPSTERAGTLDHAIRFPMADPGRGSGIGAPPSLFPEPVLPGRPGPVSTPAKGRPGT
jgi:hypothetical protein